MLCCVVLFWVVLSFIYWYCICCVVLFWVELHLLALHLFVVLHRVELFCTAQYRTVRLSDRNRTSLRCTFLFVKEYNRSNLPPPFVTVYICSRQYHGIWYTVYPDYGDGTVSSVTSAVPRVSSAPDMERRQTMNSRSFISLSSSEGLRSTVSFTRLRAYGSLLPSHVRFLRFPVSTYDSDANVCAASLLLSETRHQPAVSNLVVSCVSHKFLVQYCTLLIIVT